MNGETYVTPHHITANLLIAMRRDSSDVKCDDSSEAFHSQHSQRISILDFTGRPAFQTDLIETIRISRIERS